MKSLPFRQIHMDFHTSPFIPGVGEQFDPEGFVKTLRDAHVNSINLFAKCHHGMYYYPTKIGTMHPQLQFDLFGKQVKACRENGIRPVAYTCVAWNEDWADRHPEWLCFTYDGLRGNKLPFEKGHVKWNSLCINNKDYRKVVKAELEEIYDNYKPDGFWIDIIVAYECVCATCQKEMKELGMDPTDRSQVIRHDRMVEIEFCRDIYEYLKSMDKDLEIYFNSHPYDFDTAEDKSTSSASKRNYFSFIDIESLPSEDWGYNHFPMAANYVNKYDLQMCMMNGKFHNCWGDFGTLRNEAALGFETSRALAYGARICVGDQLHPSGKIEEAVYNRIGKIFEGIEGKEAWCRDTRKVCDVGVFIASKENEKPNTSHLPEEGAYRILTELHIPFDFLNHYDDISKYELLILPDQVQLTQELAERLDNFVSRGGKVLLTGKSGVDEKSGRFMPGFVKAQFLGASEYEERYVRLTDDCFKELPHMDHMQYVSGYSIKSDEKALARIVPPYFNRAYDRFCSHRQTPPQPDASDEPAIIMGEGYIYTSLNLFTDYITNGYKVHKDIIGSCIQQLYKQPLVKSDLPYITELTLRENDDAYIMHLLNYVKEKKSKKLEIVETEFTVCDCGISVKTPFTPQKVRLVPEGKDIEFKYADGYTTFNLEKTSGHTMVEIVR